MPYETEKGQAQIAALWKEDPLVTPSGDWELDPVKKPWGSSGQWDECQPAVPWQQRWPAAFWDALEGAEPLDQGFTAVHSKRQETAGVSWNTAGSTQAHRWTFCLWEQLPRGRGAVSTLMGFRGWVKHYSALSATLPHHLFAWQTTWSTSKPAFPRF